MYSRKSILDYLDETAAKTPVPGGGSVAALAGALAAALAQMTGRFTSGKKFEDVEEQSTVLTAQAGQLLERLKGKIDKDIDAYLAVNRAQKMPSSTEDEKVEQQKAMEEGLEGAALIPRDTAWLLTQLLDTIEMLISIANPNLLSHIGLAALLAEAAFRGAALNIRINLAKLSNPEKVRLLWEELIAMETGISSKKERIINEVIRKIEGK